MPGENYANEPKAKWRRGAIIDPWIQFTGEDHVPAGRTYETLCGPMSKENLQEGAKGGGCELRYLLDQKFLTPPQFHGLEIETAKHDANLVAVAEVFPDPSCRPTLDGMDILRYINLNYTRDTFWPAIVNLDFKGAPKGNLLALAQTMIYLNLKPGPTMLVWNVAVESYYLGRADNPVGAKHGAQHEFELMRRFPLFRRAFREGRWQVIMIDLNNGPNFAPPEYQGSATKMQTLVLGRPA